MKVAASEGLGFEAASIGELTQALAHSEPKVILKKAFF
jgi:hypothetical protein